MPDPDLLTVVAEIAFGFTGFAGLAGVLAAEETRARVALRFWIMIEFGLATLLLALLPLVLRAGGLAPGRAAMASSVAVSAFLLLHLAIVGPRIRGAMAEGAWQLGRPLLDLSFPLVAVICLATQLLNAAGLAFERSAGGVAVGLFLLLALSGLNFVALLLALRLETAGTARRNGEGPLRARVDAGEEEGS